jgi:hypothetical protein
MITPHHLIYNSALARRFFPHWPTPAVLAGALFPDIWVWLYFAWYSLVQHTPERLLWGDLYFKSGWNAIFCLAHSFWLLPLCAALSAWWRKPGLTGFFCSALFHAVCDFSVHHSDAYRHFYPFSDWIFHSPVSYWERDFHGHLISMLEGLFSIVCLGYWLRQLSGRWQRLGLATLIGLDALLLFSGLSHG